MKVLFIGRDFSSNTGATIVTKRNYKVCVDVFGQENVFLKPIPIIGIKVKLLFLTLMRYMGGLTPAIEHSCIRFVKENNISLVVIDGSHLGRIAKQLKKQFPLIRIVIFYHNTEYLYFKALLKESKKIWHWLSVRAVYYNEKIAAKYSEDRIVLNYRDAYDLFKIYAKEATLILPVTYLDRFNSSKAKSTTISETKALFVGTLFFPNYQGIKWFIENVLPEVACKLTIVGRGFEAKREELASDKVEVIGTTDDIDMYYYNASFVVAPIFIGSGMKTKTAEALMFGRTVLGTKEAFEGYDLNMKEIGVICNTKDEFIKAINDILSNKNKNAFNGFARNHFMENHDYHNALNKFRNYILQRNYNV